MTELQVKLISGLTLVSVGLIVIPIIYTLVKRGAMYFSPGKGERRKQGKALGIFSVLLILAIWCLRYAVGYYSIITAAKSALVLTPAEEVINSILSALKTFAMGTEYEQYTLTGKEMMLAVTGSNALADFFGIFAFVLNLAAPIAGGAIVFEVLAGIFPKIRLVLSYLAVWREKNYFSELNERSLALAKSIADEKSGFSRPIIIFANAYNSSGGESSSERLSFAKAMGGICVRESLKYIPKSLKGKRRIFLIDNIETRNLQALIDLSDKNNSKYMRSADIYLFSQDDIYTRVETTVREKFQKEYGFKEDELNIYPVQSHRNLVSNLLTELPLYEPLVNKPKDKDGQRTLTVTVMGTGELGTEMFLSAYWFGQILDCKLNINVVSKESEASFTERINYLNPEILQTAKTNAPILRYNASGDCCEPYFKLNYIGADVRSEELFSRIADTDYYMIALGSDSDNLSVAQKLQRYVGREHINADKKTVITYIVYDTELCNTLNRKTLYGYFNKDRADICMRAFGSLDELYSYSNIFMTKHELLAKEIGEAYSATHADREKTNKQRMRDDYNYWANLSRAMHVKYKVFSLGLITTSVFDSLDENSSAHITGVAEACARYKETAKDLGDIKHRLAWLEHRRWSAFTRVKGFRGTADYLAYYPLTGSYKNMALKLHPCLVECCDKGLGSGDLLDELTNTLTEKGIIDYDFKTYDYPEHEF